MDYGFPAISPSGSLLACGARVPGSRAMRPIFVASLADGTTRKVGDDCGGRPRQWIDERLLLIERFGSRLNTVALLDTTSGDQWDLLSSPEYSIANPRVSPDGRWIAFDATHVGGRPGVFVASFRVDEAIRQADWVAVDRSASHPFWSADGTIVYHLPTTPSTEFRNVVRARHFDPVAGLSSGESFTALASPEMVVPASISGSAPVATLDRMILVLGDFRGDVWTIDV